MPDRRGTRRRITLGADEAHDVTSCVGDLRARKAAHIAVYGAVSKTGKVRKTAMDGRAGHEGWSGQRVKTIS